MNIELLPISKNEFLKISSENLKGYVYFSYSNKLNGIYYNNKLLGLICLSPAFGYLSIDIMILPEYRRLGIASYVLNKIVLNGYKYSQYERFICLCAPKNIASNNLLSKLKWHADSSFDEIMLNEGGEFFYIYYQENPYYQKLRTK